VIRIAFVRRSPTFIYSRGAVDVSKSVQYNITSKIKFFLAATRTTSTSVFMAYGEKHNNIANNNIFALSSP